MFVFYINDLLFRIESDTIGVFFSIETLDNFSSFGIPIINHFVVTGTEKVKSVVRKSDIPDSLPVSDIIAKFS